MNSFSPIFSQIVDSSLWMEPDFVCKVFVTLLAIKDADHVARVNAFALGRKCWPSEPKESEGRAIEALRILQEPDTRRLEPQENEGRRVERVEDGYLVLNGQFYEDLMRKVSRRVYKARKEREYREQQKCKRNGNAAKGATALERLAAEAHDAGDEKTFNDAVTASLPEHCQ